MNRSADKPDIKVLAVNRAARHDFEIQETFEAGLALVGTEVKSCRGGRIQFKDAYGKLKAGEVWLVGCHIGPYEHAIPEMNHDPERPRKVLLRQSEIRRLTGKVERAGFTLVPLRMYLKGPWIKLELALARGRAKHEKKEVLKKRIQEREVRQALKSRSH